MKAKKFKKALSNTDALKQELKATEMVVEKLVYQLTLAYGEICKMNPNQYYQERSSSAYWENYAKWQKGLVMMNASNKR